MRKAAKDTANGHVFPPSVRLVVMTVRLAQPPESVLGKGLINGLFSPVSVSAGRGTRFLWPESIIRPPEGGRRSTGSPKVFAPIDKR